jgi:hypothetical protein
LTTKRSERGSGARNEKPRFLLENQFHKVSIFRGFRIPIFLQLDSFLTFAPEPQMKCIQQSKDLTIYICFYDMVKYIQRN